jgi:hypothetical protein
VESLIEQKMIEVVQVLALMEQKGCAFQPSQRGDWIQLRGRCTPGWTPETACDILLDDD